MLELKIVRASSYFLDLSRSEKKTLDSRLLKTSFKDRHYEVLGHDS